MICTVWICYVNLITKYMYSVNVVLPHGLDNSSFTLWINLNHHIHIQLIHILFVAKFYGQSCVMCCTTSHRVAKCSRIEAHSCYAVSNEVPNMFNGEVALNWKGGMGMSGDQNPLFTPLPSSLDPTLSKNIKFWLLQETGQEKFVKNLKNFQLCSLNLAQNFSL